MLFTVYLRLSWTHQLNSDSANMELMGWDMLHGNVLLHGWDASDFSCFTFEVPVYAGIEAALGLTPAVTHAAGALIYTLVVLLGALLAKGTGYGRAAWCRALLAGGIMLGPQLGAGVYYLLVTAGHIGIAAPLLLTWLLLDRVGSRPLSRRARWYVVAATGVLLTWAGMDDPLTYVLGTAPLAVVGLGRAVRRRGDRWYELALAGSALAATAISAGMLRLIERHGGFTVRTLPFRFEWFAQNGHLARTGWAILVLFGADFRNAGSGAALAVVLLHLTGVALAAAGLLVLARSVCRAGLVDQVLAAGIAANLALFMSSYIGRGNAHEIAPVLPYSAVLAARMLLRAPAVTAAFGTVAGGTAAAGTVARGTAVRQAVLAVGGLALAGYLFGLAREDRAPKAGADASALAGWLAAHHLTSGLAGYWNASVVTVQTSGQVRVRALRGIRPYLWETKVAWYDPHQDAANFIVLQQGVDLYRLPEVRQHYGAPVRTYTDGPYTIMVWNQNLLSDIPGAWLRL